MDIKETSNIRKEDKYISKIAFYLPQFYPFPENDKWWGKGFTEWTNVKKAKPLYKGHYQPTVPLGDNYYSLENIETMKWQVELARKYGIEGFCFYHYWFGDNKLLMEKPVDNFLEHKEIDFPFCLSWANHSWTRTWVGDDTEVLLEVKYGKEDEWEQHFQYLIPFFKDDRYIKVEGKPVFIIYLPEFIPDFGEMVRYYNKRAQEEGLKGITFVSQTTYRVNQFIDDIDYIIEYEPNYSRLCIQEKEKHGAGLAYYLARFDLGLYRLKGFLGRISKGKIFFSRTHSYSLLWNYIIKHKKDNPKMIAGAFVKCDVTPRRQERAIIYRGASPKKFGKYLSKLINKVQNDYKLPVIFISAWNEWGEGMYLEPDKKYRYQYLEAVKRCSKHCEDN